MPLYGYARVSTLDQDLGIQRAALKAAGCKVIRAEKASGARRDGRTELQVLLDFVQPGDTLVVTRIDRLARSMKDLQDIVHELKQKGVALRATEQPVDTGTAAGKAFLDRLGVFAEFETNLRRERQLEGIKAAKAKGITRDASPPSTRPSYGACATRRSSGLPPSRAGSASGGPASTGCSESQQRQHSPSTQASGLLCGWYQRCWVNPMKRFLQEVEQIWQRALARRSQKLRMFAPRFLKLLRRLPLPGPTIINPYRTAPGT